MLKEITKGANSQEKDNNTYILFNLTIQIQNIILKELDLL
jgi:hypothetical protein